jgi:L-lactate dehydrogenase complex protein LldG
MEGADAVTNSREDVLAGITRQIRVGHPPPASTFDHPGPFPLPSRPSDSGSLVAGFSRELETLTGKAYQVPDDGAAIGMVTMLLADRRARRILAWEPEWLNTDGLADALRRAGTTIEPCWLPADPQARTARLLELDDVLVGLTGAAGALADTGSLALVSGAGRGRIASLLPPTHIAIVRAEQLYPSLPHFLASHPAITDDGSNLVLITGPSRTADIEMTLTRGVHGPGEIIAIIVG